jgi:hypothetical protein
MRHLIIATTLLACCAPAGAAPMLEIKGVRPAEGCLETTKAVTERLVMCPTGGVRIRIWCPNGKVFDRDGPSLGVAVARSICEMNQLPG